MFSLTVSDHLMIAHSFTGEIFGPAQRLHGATYVVEVEIRRLVLDADGLVADIGAMRRMLREVLDTLDYRNLDEEPTLIGRNTTTEFLAKLMFDRMQRKIATGALGTAATNALTAMKVTLRESPVAWAAYEGQLG
jgi:6-pyruvoyl-tetrahydropterin synthase